MHDAAIHDRQSQRHAWGGKWHHPDLAWPVIGRRVGEELIGLLAFYLEAVQTGGRSLTWGRNFPNPDAYYAAVYRLRRSGLIVDRTQADQPPVLALAPEALSRLPACLRPESCWNRKWNRLWYLLVYDIPEKQRATRDTLRHFLSRLRLGNLQRSVLVTPNDIRPLFDDLCKASDIGNHVHLFEARTVLGRSAMDIVQGAWPFDRIGERQDQYIQESNALLLRLRAEPVSKPQAVALARLEMGQYRAAMLDDPLLPQDLLPDGYRGREAWCLHKACVRAIAAHI